MKPEHNSNARIALDVEGVLADSHTPTYERCETLSDGHDQQWGFDTSKERDEFMKVSKKLWRDDYDLIKETETPNFLGYCTRRLQESVNQLDVVTGRLNVNEQVETWLADHNIAYDNLVFADQTKANYDYDVYIDDKPALVHDVLEDTDAVIYLVDGSQNAGALDGVSSQRAQRVSVTSEALWHIRESVHSDGTSTFTEPAHAQ